MARDLLSGTEVLARVAAAAGFGPLLAAPGAPLDDLERELPRHGYPVLSQDLEAAGMAFGAAAGGSVPLLMVSGSGLARVSEVLSAAAAAELPMVIAACTRAGPGSGNDSAAQTDYLRATRAPGPGGIRVPVLAPDSPSEVGILYLEAVEWALAERTPVILLLDALVARSREAVLLPGAPDRASLAAFPGLGDGPSSSILGAAPATREAAEALSLRLVDKARGWAGRGRADLREAEDAELVLVAFGSAARIAETTVEKARKRGIRLCRFRPVHLSPFPEAELRELLGRVRGALVVELSEGQLLADVRALAPPGLPIAWHGRLGGAVPSPFELMHKVQELLEALP